MSCGGEFLRGPCGPVCGPLALRGQCLVLLACAVGLVAFDVVEHLGLEDEEAAVDVVAVVVRLLAEAAHPLFAGQQAEGAEAAGLVHRRSEEHTSELQSLMRISYAVFCLKKKNNIKHSNNSIRLKQHTSPHTPVYTPASQPHLHT